MKTFNHRSIHWRAKDVEAPTSRDPGTTIALRASIARRRGFGISRIDGRDHARLSPSAYARLWKSCARYGRRFGVRRGQLIGSKWSRDYHQRQLSRDLHGWCSHCTRFGRVFSPASLCLSCFSTSIRPF